MRPTDSHIITRARQVVLALCFSISLSAGNLSADSILLDAYRHEDMSVWKEYIDQHDDLLYQYGYCGYLVGEYKAGRADLEQAIRYVSLFKSQIIHHQSQMPVGHYEMYISAVYVYELRLKASIHPFKAMSLAKEATRLAPNDPLVLSYYGTCLFYAPQPIGSKQEALTWFEKAEKFFHAPQWKYCWVREANEMYINQCKEKLKK